MFSVGRQERRGSGVGGVLGEDRVESFGWATGYRGVVPIGAVDQVEEGVVGEVEVVEDERGRAGRHLILVAVVSGWKVGLERKP